VGNAWLARIAARTVDREPPASPQVAAAQLGALTKWGHVTGERYGSLKNIRDQTLVVYGHDDITVPTVNWFISSTEASRRPAHSLPCFRAWRAFQFAEKFAEAAARFLAADRASYSGHAARLPVAKD